MIARLLAWIGRMGARPRRRLQLAGFGHAMVCPIHRGCILLGNGSHVRARRERFAGVERY